MLFTDPLFLFYFLPATLLLLRLCSWSGRINGMVKVGIIASTLVFYAYENWLWVLVFTGVVGGTYTFGWFMAAAQRDASRRILLGASIAYCVLFLSVFKYLNWLSQLMPALRPLQEAILPWYGAHGVILLPPGISFYVFEAISYCFDIYRRKINPPRNPLDFLCFIAMFPRFIAGPIVRYADLQGQIASWSGLRIARGLTLFSFGFGLKCLFADQFAVFVPYAFEVGSPDFVQSWIGVLAYTFQLYFDFWSYSIMATGLGLCLGFEFPDNFRGPYHAISITQFWQRWHISLSTWLRDYVYIPFGGNRVASWRIQVNLMLTMLIGGLWHGASSTFVVWGAYHGLLLAMERALGESRLSRVPAPIRQVSTLLLVCGGWTLFRSESFSQAWQVWSGLVGVHGFAPAFNGLLIQKQGLAAILAIGGLIFWLRGERWLIRDKPLATLTFPPVIQYLGWFILLLSLVVASSSSEIPFLYFQF